MLYTLAHRAERRTIQAVLGVEPQVNAGLVANLDGGVQVGKQLRRLPNHGVLGLGAEVGVPGEQVVVLDVVGGRVARLRVPDRAEQ